MATTAAPSFFPSYKIEGRGIFLDGALHLNNPAMAAYEKAIQYNVAKRKGFRAFFRYRELHIRFFRYRPK